tara:strand:+ start:205 stop:531 length:327 start_codon:yes stop_codon:yes gene_type:complete
MIKVYQMNLVKESESEDYENNLEAFRGRYDGSKSFNPSLFKYYSCKAHLNTDDLDEAFVLMNRWSDSDRLKIDLLSDRVASLSVGDILESELGTMYMVDPEGFQEVRV